MFFHKRKKINIPTSVQMVRFCTWWHGHTQTQYMQQPHESRSNGDLIHSFIILAVSGSSACIKCEGHTKLQQVINWGFNHHFVIPVKESDYAECHKSVKSKQIENFISLYFHSLFLDWSQCLDLARRILSFQAQKHKLWNQRGSLAEWMKTYRDTFRNFTDTRRKGHSCKTIYLCT